MNSKNKNIICIYPDPKTCHHATCVNQKKKTYVCKEPGIKCSYRVFKPKNITSIIKKEKEKIKNEI